MIWGDIYELEFDEEIWEELIEKYQKISVFDMLHIS